MPPRGKKTGASARGKAWVKGNVRQPQVQAQPQGGSQNWWRNMFIPPGPSAANDAMANAMGSVVGAGGTRAPAMRQARGGAPLNWANQAMPSQDWWRGMFVAPGPSPANDALANAMGGVVNTGGTRTAGKRAPRPKKQPGMGDVQREGYAPGLDPNRVREIPRPVRVGPYGGYTDPLGGGGTGGDLGAGWNDWGGGGGYSYPDYSYGGGSGAYASPQGRGYNPTLNQTPRWWHNRLSWRF